ncbi:RIIA lysis inhibitor [Rhizobium phage RHEph10]|uniref:RIIA lysis inhibitor n=1 Tax=Rhizobium phage RHEph10 TaxID=1220717 RepID=UPI0002AB1D33|nr:RIIA lysis inhibitor [Rhizobium phage RHEph10]AGC36127.1 putative rIIA-like protein [Rhizobium phage RHEph10]
MEVSQVAALDTHVIIGGGAPEAFGMADTAEFYDVLSDNIYRDKKRAAMRETICNAWDAHIMVGKTDVPVEITVTDTEIVIKDFGPGIPDHLMRPIYCVYGASTKVKDGKQTGGFGLGSKSPFAVGDHFNVVNEHAGFKTVYALSRGGAATQGKPDMRPMVRVPSVNTGITVTIPLKNVKDRPEFEAHIRAVVRQGGMLANLNGQPLFRNDYTEARKTEYCLIPQTGLWEGKVYVLYGTVIYPLTTTDEDLLALAHKAGSYTCRESILLLCAPPNSIGVTPSRESLSYSDTTTETLTRLLQKACRQINAAIPAAIKRVAHARLERWGVKAFDRSFDAERRTCGILSTPAMIADHAVATNSAHMSAKQARRTMLKVAAPMFRDDRRWYRRAVHEHYSNDELNFRRTSMPAIRIASQMGLLKDLMLFDLHRNRLALPGPKTQPIAKYHRIGHVHAVLCVARNLRDLRPTLNATSGRFRNEEHSYVPGVVMRQWTEKNLKALRELCSRFKIELVEFDYEEEKERRASQAKRVKTEEKYLTLEDYIKSGYRADPTCNEPAFYMMTWQRDEIPRTPFDTHLVKAIVEKFPNTALITTKAQEEKFKKLGIRNLAEVAAARLVELTKLREVVYGELIRHDRIAADKDRFYHGSLADAVLKLAKLDVRIAKMLFPDRSTPGEAHREAALLWDFLVNAQSLSEETTAIVKAAKKGLRRACAELFKPLTADEVDRRFAYLEVLRGANIIGSMNYRSTSKEAENLIEVIKILQRRSSKSKLIAHNTQAAKVTTAHKEAA